MAELIRFQQQQQQLQPQPQPQRPPSQNRNSVFGRDNRNQKLRQSNFGKLNLRSGKAAKSKSKNVKNISVFGKSGKQNSHQKQREEFLKQRALRLLNLHWWLSSQVRGSRLLCCLLHIAYFDKMIKSIVIYIFLALVWSFYVLNKRQKSQHFASQE